MIRPRGTGAPEARGGTGGRIVAAALALAGFFGLWAIPAAAAPGDLDPGFSDDGKVVAFGTESFTMRELGFSDLVLQADGGIVGAGDDGLFRLNPDGTPDDSFSTDSDEGRSLAAVALQPDGKLVAAGYEDVSWMVRGDFVVARYNADGTRDATFAGDGIATLDFGGHDDAAKALALQPDGKIVVAGRSVEQDADDVPSKDFALARYNPDGTLDTTFSGDGKRTTDFADDTAHDVALQPDGKIVMVGSISGDFALARYDEDGQLDPAFSDDGRVRLGFTDERADGGRALVIQPDGGIVAAGGTSGGFTLARFNTDGSLDPTFGGDGVVTTDLGGTDRYPAGARDVVLESGRLLAAGQSYGDFALARYELDGELDAGFSGDGMLTTDMAYSDGATSIAIRPDGRIVVGGYTWIYGGDWSLDSSYGAIARYLASEGPADADADAVLDSSDLCPQVFTPGESDGCPRYRASISLAIEQFGSGRRRWFTGEAGGAWDCLEGSRVRIYRLKRGGRRVKVASAELYYDSDYGWFYGIKTERTRGRYRAKLRRELLPDVGWCGGARSPVVKIPRE